MPIIANEGDSKPKQLPPAGTHVARCYSVVDLGTQTLEYAGETKRIRKVRVTWELPNELAVFKEENGEQPFVISKEYSLSLYEKANLRHDLESWRGKQFSEEELKGFDILTLIGAPCMLSVIHKTKGDKTYANVTGVGRLPKGMTAPEQINEKVAYSLDDGRSDVFIGLPEWLRKKIEACQEWNEEPPTASEDDAQEQDDDSNIPF